jgi:pilus assembly protein Flp/PilA
MEDVIMKSPDMTQTNEVAMSRDKRPLRNQKLKGKQKGLTMVEYAVAGSLITAAAVAAFIALGEQVTAVIEFITGEITQGGG